MHLRTIPPRSATGNMTHSSKVTVGCLGRSRLKLTMRMQACFPSMKPLGMAFAARISYLKTQGRSQPTFSIICVLSRARSILPHPSRLTVAGTLGRQSCWGSPDGRCGCLPTHHCSAAVPAPETHPACQTEGMEEVSEHWSSPARKYTWRSVGS